jgi:hypothetical protein
VERAIAFTGILWLWHDLHDSDRADETQQAREECGIVSGAGDDEIGDRLLAIAAQEALTAKELAELRESL